jgi:hypothetical protein
MEEQWKQGSKVSIVEEILHTRVPAEIQQFLDVKGLTAEVILLANEDIKKFPGTNRDSITINTARTKATIASVFHRESERTTDTLAKKAFANMFSMICKDMVHDMHEVAEVKR